MKKIILTIALAVVAAVCANAQIGVNVGYTSKNFTNVMNNEAGLFAGANYNIELVNGICVAPGVEFAMLNYTKDENNYQKENYLAVPIMFNYGLQLADGFKLVPYLGPTISFGLSSVVKGGVSGFGITLTTGDVDMYDGTDYNKLDIQIGGGVALDVMDMVRAFVGYNQGLINRNNDADGSVIKTSGLNFGVSYLF